MSSIVYSRIKRPRRQLDLPLNPVTPGVTGATSFGVPHYDIITIGGVAYEAYSCGCPKTSGHDPFPKLDHEGKPLCKRSARYRNDTYYPDMNHRHTTTLQCGCKFNYWYGGYCHSPEACIHNKVARAKMSAPTDIIVKDCYQRLLDLEQRVRRLEQ